MPEYKALDAETVRSFREKHGLGLLEAIAILRRREIVAALHAAEASGGVPEPVLRWMRMMTPQPSYTEQRIRDRETLTNA